MKPEGFNLYCVDPGDTTGIVWLSAPADEAVKVVEWFELPRTPLSGVGSNLLRWSLKKRKLSKSLIIMEDWWNNPRKQVDPRPVCEVIGAVKMMALINDSTPVVMQTAALRLDVPDTQPELGHLGLWIPGYKKGTKQGDTPRGDARQAMRHGVHWLLARRHIPTMELFNPRSD